MAKVLVVDDEANIRELVSVYLVAAGHSVETAEDGPSALEVFRRSEPDLVVLDLMLPGLDGREVCRRIREESTIPVIMLTARDADVDKVELLDAGADDYVTKPFSPPELMARVRAVLRRAGAKATGGGDVLEHGGLVVDLPGREVTLDGSPVTLTAKEFDLLTTLMSRPGVVFSRQQLLDAVWGFAEYVDQRGVDVHIRHLRQKLGDDASAPRFIETVRGAGYRFVRGRSG
ncbi:MAG: response regulator transcription factor [Coriobacteriia bacterium]